MNQLFTILANQYALPVLGCLRENPKQYKMIAVILNVKPGTQYYILRKMREYNLVSLVPSKYNHTQHMYAITERGRLILDRFVRFNALIEVMN